MKIVKINSKLYKEKMNERNLCMNLLFNELKRTFPSEKIFLSAISKCINGKSTSPKQHLLICNYFDISIADIFYLAEEE